MLEHLTPDQTQALLTAVLAAIAALFALLLIVAIPLARRALKYLSDLVGVKVSDDQMKVVDSLIATGIHYAEEQARKAARNLIAGPKTGEEKKQVAKDVAISLAPPALAESLRSDDAKLDVMIEAKLQSMRPWLPSVESTGDAARSLPPSGYSLPPPAVGRMSIPGAPRLPSDPGTVFREPETIPQTPSSKRGK